MNPRITVLATFFIHGAVFSTWVSRIPAVQASLQLSTGTLGLALLGIAAGSMISMPVAGWVIHHYGSRALTAISSLWFCLALILPALATSAVTLGFALAVLGLAAGAMDVAMNAQGVLVERAAHKPVMSGFHAMFSIGGMAGSGLGGLVARAGVPVRMHFLIAALVYTAIVLSILRGLVPEPPAGPHGKQPFRITAVILGLAVIAFCLFLSEGAIADWSALYLVHTLGAGPALAAAGYAFFSAAMAIGRFAGDPLRARFGSVFLVRAGSLLASAGLVLAILLEHPISALAGFTLVGFGCSIIVPIAFAAAAAETSSSLAVVVAAGYFGLFVGPPTIGLAAEILTLRWALLIVVGLLAVAALLARSTRIKSSEAQT